MKTTWENLESAANLANKGSGFTLMNQDEQSITLPISVFLTLWHIVIATAAAGELMTEDVSRAYRKQAEARREIAALKAR